MNLWMATAADTDMDMTSPGHTKPQVCKTWSQSIRNRALGTEICWQWEHRTGFRDYFEHEGAKIEDAYQRGCDNARLKAGKTRAPMEIFFRDMLQYDPVTMNSRRIRRLGTDSLFRLLLRLLRRSVRHAFEGQKKDFQGYKQMMREMEGLVDKRSTASYTLYNNSIFAAITRSSWFFAVSMFLVLLNAAWICIDADREGSHRVDHVPLYVTVSENTFCIAFAIELFIRFAAFSRTRNCFRDAWWCFDFGLVTLMIFETWFIPLYFFIFHLGSDGSTGTGDWVILRVARILRLSRLGRIARLLRALPEVYMLLKGIAAAIRSVFVTLLLLCALLLLFGVVFRQQAADNEALAEIFSSVGTSMWLLLLHGTLLDTPSMLLNQVGNIEPLLAAVLLAFIFLSSFTVLNMLIGILVGVVHNVAESEKDQAAVQYLKSTLVDILECHDKDGDGALERKEFQSLMKNPEVHIVLTRFGVDVADLISLQDRLFGPKFVAPNFQEETQEDAVALKVTVVEARNLRAADFSWLLKKGKSDPYCTVEVPAKANVAFKTKTVIGSQDPKWNHQRVLKPFVPSDAIRITVWDEDWGKEDDFLGRTTLQASQFLPGGMDCEVPLRLPGGGAGGFVHVKIEVLPLEAEEAEAQGTRPLSFQHFLEVVMRLRGGNRATVHDVVELRGLLLGQFRRLFQHLDAGAAKGQMPTSSSLVGSSTSSARLPAEPTGEKDRAILSRLTTLDANQRELHTELRALKSQVLELRRSLQVCTPPVGSPPYTEPLGAVRTLTGR